MDCDFAEKISLLVDGELDEADAKAAAEHLISCEACRQAREEYLSLRVELRAVDPLPNPAMLRIVQRRILGSERVPVWKKSVALPAPVFALLLVALVALGAWAAFVRRGAGTPAQEAGTMPEKVLPMPAREDARGGIDLARYDRGERAAIYKVRLKGGVVVGQ